MKAWTTQDDALIETIAVDGSWAANQRRSSGGSSDCRRLSTSQWTIVADEMRSLHLRSWLHNSNKQTSDTLEFVSSLNSTSS